MSKEMEKCISIFLNFPDNVSHNFTQKVLSFFSFKLDIDRTLKLNAIELYVFEDTAFWSDVSSHLRMLYSGNKWLFFLNF